MVVALKNDAAATLVTFILNPEMMYAINRTQKVPFFGTMFFVESKIRILWPRKFCLYLYL